MIGMSVLLVLVLVIGGTYAWFTLQLKGTKVNVLKAGSLSLVLNDVNSVGINSEKAVPILDKVGETLDPYHFTLENNSHVSSSYTIYLDDVDLEEGETRMSDSFVKYQLTKDGTKTTALLNTIGENPNRVLDSGTIHGNQTITYDLRLWIDENTGNEAMGTTLKTKIRVVATQSDEVLEGNPNILNVYRYSTEDGTKCITGEESSCVELTERPETYTAGTIIKYKVNDTLEKYFHVMFDEGDRLVLQQRENTISATMWYDVANDNTKGPLTVLPLLENETSGWTNVLDQEYSMGTTPFQTKPFTGCTVDSTTKEIDCTVNTYTLSQRTAKARMITTQEASRLGCKYLVDQSCPVWMNNYLKENESYGGTVSHDTDLGYWTMSVDSSNMLVFTMAYIGSVSFADTMYTSCGARAVVVIDKYRFS